MRNCTTILAAMALLVFSLPAESLAQDKCYENDIEVSCGQTDPVSVPEPEMLGLLAIGLAAMGLARRRRNKK